MIGLAPLIFSRAAAFTYAGRAQGIVRGAQEGSHEGNRIAGPVGGTVGAVKGVFGIPDRGRCVLAPQFFSR
nr:MULTISPECIES: hypothetical protein [unclassified Bradyrhizobium]